MRKFLGLLLTGILLFCTIFSIAGCCREKSEEETARRLIAANSKVEVPTNSEMVYLISEESKGFVHGGDFQYAVFEFDAFDRVGNKLYLAIGSDGEGYVELADGDPEVVMSIIQKQADELIINVGYHLPGTQLYITLVPAE